MSDYKPTLDEEIYDILIVASNVVGQTHFRKGESKDRGKFLLIQALLHVELAVRIKDLLALHGIRDDEDK